MSPLVLQMLPLVSGKVHEVHQQVGRIFGTTVYCLTDTLSFVIFALAGTLTSCVPCVVATFAPQPNTPSNCSSRTSFGSLCSIKVRVITLSQPFNRTMISF